MKNLFLLAIAVFLLSSCGGGGGLFSNKDKYGFEAQPKGMIFVPGGSFTMGSSDEDVMWAMNSIQKQITVDAFWMDETEVTNLAYRQFVGWVGDSTARTIMAKGGVDGFALEPEEGEEEDPENPKLNWKTKINLKKNEDQLDALKQGDFFYSKDESIDGKREIDVRQLSYKFQWMDLKQAANAKYDPKTKKYIGTIVKMDGTIDSIKDRSSFIMSDEVYIYPDTLCWIRDFNYSFNDPFASRYFSHPSYNQYPMVGASWKQAKAYAHWRTNHSEERMYRKQFSEPHAYRLPTEAEWEYGARGGLDRAMFPWGKPYATNKFGCYLANFKPQRGNYALDGGQRTMPVGTYESNDYGLYDMAGNVAEWTDDAYDENSYSFTHDLVPVYAYNAKDYEHSSMKRKSIRGGSWKDISYFIQCGTRSYEYQDSTKSYIGFRLIRDLLGQPNE